MLRYLTKSRFTLAIGCPTKLFYCGKPKEYKDNMQENTFLAMLAEGGYQVGALAKLAYPEGIEITEKNHLAAHAKTLEYLVQENVVLFEPAILVGDFFIRIDVLVKKGNSFELIEVKAKSYDSLNPSIAGKQNNISSGMLPYIQDAAFQTWVLQQALPEAEISTFLLMPDKSKSAMVDGLNQMFKISERGGMEVKTPRDLDTQQLAKDLLAKVCIDQYVSEVITKPMSYAGGEDFLPATATQWANAYKLDQKIRPVLGAQCGGCQFRASAADKLKSGFHECWKQANNWQDADFENGTVLDLWNFRKKSQLINQGVFKLSQLNREDIGDFDDEPSTQGLNRMQRQWLQVNGIPQDYDFGGYYFDHALLTNEIANWKFPYHFIDFETSAVALPFYKGMRPYEQVAFQFSHHVMEADGNVRHAGEFLLAEPGEFPNYLFARALKAELDKDGGSVFMWSHHENTIISAIIKQLSEDEAPPKDATELIEFLSGLIKGGQRAMIDLCTVAEKGYFHPFTQGSNSIKKVLPAVLNTSSFLRETYSQPIYGAPDGIPSLNFNSQDGFAWLDLENREAYSDPYSKLKNLVIDSAEENIEANNTSVIADGGAAATAYARLQFEDISNETRQKIKASMLRYCEVDTLAMVMVTQAWIADLKRESI